MEKAGLDPAAAAPSQPDRLDGSPSDHSALKLVTRLILLNQPSGLSDYHPGGRAGQALPPQDRAPLSPLSSLFSFSSFKDERRSNLSFENPNPNRRTALRTITETPEVYAMCIVGGDDVWTLTIQETRLSCRSTCYNVIFQLFVPLFVSETKSRLHT